MIRVFLSLFISIAAQAHTPEECALTFNSIPLLKIFPFSLGNSILPTEIESGIAIGIDRDGVLGIGLNIKTEDRAFFETSRLQTRALSPHDSRTKILRQLEHPSFLLFWVDADHFQTPDGLWLPGYALRALEAGKFVTGDEWKDIVFFFPVIEKSSQKMVGFVSWVRNDMTQTLEIAYGIFEQERNKGFAAEIAQALVNKIKSENPSYSIQARVKKANRTSINLLENIGFQKSGEKDEILSFTLRNP